MGDSALAPPVQHPVTVAQRRTAAAEMGSRAYQVSAEVQRKRRVLVEVEMLVTETHPRHLLEGLE